MYLTIDGHETFVYTGGRTLEGRQPFIVFVHGAGLDHVVFSMQCRYFAHHGFNAVAPDLPGHGRSRGELLTTIEAMGAWINALLAGLEAPGAAIVGHSMGSLVALEAAAQAGERASALVLLGTAFPMRVGKPLLDAADANAHDAIDMMTLWGHSMQAQVGGNSAPGTWVTGTTVRLLERAQSGVIGNDLNACNRYENGANAAASVHCATHLVLGQADRMTPPKAVAGIREALANVSVTVLPASGHIMMAEQPNESLDAVIRAVN